jgi:hypothetical protein
VEQGEASLERLPRGMRDAVGEVLETGETIIALWTTRGLGANALICTPVRALIAKRQLISWSVAAFPYTEIASVEVIEGRPGSAAQLVLVPPPSAAPPKPGPFDDHPDVYFQESRRLVAPNTVMFRGRRRAHEAAETVRELITRRSAP